MFTKVLIANRGEIAVRVIRSCQELGVATVAVYSDLDRNALHVRLADEAYALGGRTAAESYLDTEAILEAIRLSGADAVHPGYGFFSENADFAESIAERGVTFIGPPPSAIQVMGDKISARHAAEKVGVLGVPGSADLITDASQVAEFGESHGWPVAVKAAYGGGGRGMRVVDGPDQAADALAAAQRESLAYFGRDECYLERYLSNPRHVEVQILADSHGNCLYLGTRDCSTQRRHQKLIEEAPAPGIPAATIAAMGSAAVAVANGCGYVNAGTVEFLYEDGRFHYLEMNTRLQVEHPVTELVTGIDLVEQQLRIASGETLGFEQADIVTRGHAIELRINAEDPADGAFLPCPGTITSMSTPGGFGTRFDTGYESGDEVSQFYDNLIGKLIVWGDTRERTIARAIRALGELRIGGIATTSPALLAVLQHRDFAAIEHSTKWVEESLDLSGIGPADTPERSEDETPRVKRELDVEVNGKRFSVSMWIPDSSPSALRPRRNPRRHTGGVSASGSGDVAVPMQGTIVKIFVAVGDTVEVGDTIVVLEAMKMENNIVAAKSGTVAEINVAEGDSVGSGDIVAVVS